MSEAVLPVTADPTGVWAGRRAVESGLRRSAGDSVAVTGGVVARELLANAIEHGEAPVAVRLVCFADHARIEVTDGSRDVPAPVPDGADAPGLRGIDLVERLCRRWGYDPRPDGKTVWAELEFGGGPDAPRHPEVQELLGLWLDGEAHHAERYRVRLRDVPVALLLRSQARVAALVGPDGPAAGAGIPPHLREQLREAAAGLRPVRDALVREALTAAAHGEEWATFTLHLPPGTAAAGEAFLDLMERIDRCADAAGSPAAAPADERLLRRWCVRSIVRQLPASSPD